MDAQSNALLAHIISQTQQNIDFLVENNYITAANGNFMRSKLPALPSSNGSAPVRAPPAMAPAAVVAPVSSPVVPRVVPVPPAPPSYPAQTVQATWAYDGGDADDLSFNEGDIIELVEEVNGDWWRGRINGREGLFPSNHVTKVEAAAAAHRRLPPAVAPASAAEKKAYKPFMASHHGADTPPPPGSSQTNSVGLQEVDQSQKKSKYGKYGNTMAHSAAGGVGFGAGAAIGGGLVRAIF